MNWLLNPLFLGDEKDCATETVGNCKPGEYECDINVCIDAEQMCDLLMTLTWPK